MKGIVLAGGSGTRLYPLTLGVSKQLLPIYNKPMIYYPISILMLAGIRDILIISTPEDLPLFKRLLKDGNNLGINFSFAEQPKPEGLAQAFIIGKDFIGEDNVCLILGDNIFYGDGLTSLLESAKFTTENDNKASIFGYRVNDPERYGVAEIDEIGNVISIIEKPKNPKSNNAVVGLYFYPNDVVKIAQEINPSKRGELEITSINEHYLKSNRLKLEIMGRGYAWLDTGTFESLNEASEFIKAIEKRQGFKIGCLEEIALIKKFISISEFQKLGLDLSNSEYGQYLIKIAHEWR